MSFHVIIPARHASTRLPGKPLLAIAGRPMIEHVYRVAMASGAASVHVATDDERIADAVQAFGGQVCMTRPEHSSGSERLAEACEQLGLDAQAVVVNLQGDEPLMPPALLSQVATLLDGEGGAAMATLCTRIDSVEDLFDPNVVKLVMDAQGHALYFSRAVIPWDRDAFASEAVALPAAAHYRHLGLYAYRVGFLRDYVQQAPCVLEQRESLEQLRVLWYGGRIKVAEASALPGPGVDTAADLERVRALLDC
jgi:3-deoxy-manno-octulosonate cytidylyltransferase (CMP-KDO synthetase)